MRGGNKQAVTDMGEMVRILALIMGLLALALPATAQSNDDSPPDSTKSAQLVQQIFEGGIKAYGVGKYDEAMRAFEAAIRTGMPSQQMPRVLYYRGLTFRKMGKPGFAVSDLTSALWLKGGLSEAERADAIKNRALAYHESGVSEVPPVPQSAYAQAPALPGQTSSASTPGLAAAAAPAAPSSSGSGGGVTGFFSNLFGGGSSSSEPAPAAPASTASVASTASEPDTSGWGAATEVAPSAPARPAEVGSAFVTQVAAVGEGEKAPRGSVAGSGGIRLQVASVRSRSEAEALAGLLVGRHAGELGGRRPQVDETVIGSMGTFYRVRIGPFANEREPQKLCNALKPDGFDCLVVTE
jgi:hypothetical protein